jgi:serine/threonine protein kinase
MRGYCMKDLLGQQWGNYRLTQWLGQGGFAEIYLGEHIRLGIIAAVKILHTHLSAEGVQAFQREAQVIADLAHPHIVRVLDFDVQSGRPFLVLDYAPGGSLRQRHPRGTRVPPQQVVEYVRQVADALSYAHERKLIHRDVKPENMLLGQMNEVLLSDFGIVTIAHSTSSMSTQASMGTLPYMAPEQIQGKPRPASDQYALAVTVYQWLTGTLPFQGSSVEIIAQHLGVAAPSLRTHAPEISQEVDRVVLKALAKAPEERFVTVQDFAAALEQAVIGPLARPAIVPAPRDTRTSLHSSPTEAALQDKTTAQTSVPAKAQPHSQSTPIVSRREVITGLVIGGISVGVAALAGYGSAFSASNTSMQDSAGSNTLTRSVPDNAKYSYKLDTYGLSWSPNGKYLAALDSNRTKVYVWTPLDGKIVTTYTNKTAGFLDMAWSPDGQRIAVSSTAEKNHAAINVYVWNASDGKNILTYQGHTGFHEMAWSADGKYIATGELDGQMRIWSATDGKISHSFPWYSGPDKKEFYLTAMAWSPNGKYIAISSTGTDYPEAFHGIKILQSTNGKRVAEADMGEQRFDQAHYDRPDYIAWSHDSAYIAAYRDLSNSVQVWQASSGMSTLIYQGQQSVIEGFAWSPDGTYIASVGQDLLQQVIHVWNTKTGERAQSYSAPMDGVTDLPHAGIAWSPDGQYIAASSRDQNVRIWQAP